MVSNAMIGSTVTSQAWSKECECGGEIQ